MLSIKVDVILVMREGLVIIGCRPNEISISMKCETLGKVNFNISMLKSPQRNIVLSVESVLNKLYISFEKLMISNSGHLYIPLIIISLELGINNLMVTISNLFGNVVLSVSIVIYLKYFLTNIEVPQPRL